jgi:preprotein translocase subunit SecD
LSLRWRLGSVGALVLLLAYLALANFFPAERRAQAWYLPDEGLRLGLDLQGGIHLVISPDLEAGVAQELGHIKDGLAQQIEEKEITGARLFVEGDSLEVTVAGASDAEGIRELVADYETLQVVDSGFERLTLKLTDEWRAQVHERAMLQVLEVYRRRVDDPQTGIPESVVTRQGRDRVLIQFPGISRVPDIFRKTGHLEFKMVQDADQSEDLLRAKHPEGLPEGTEVVFERERETQRILRAYLVSQTADITGDYLTDARVGFDSRQSEWQVNFTWSSEGAEIFAALTEENIDELLAIILDGQVYSAPQIRARISRAGVITGRFSSEDAADLAVILRAGALPISVHIEEERTIGPALGADSIRSGVWAAVAGLLLVVAFIVGYYRLSGGYASLALLANLLMVVGLMSLFEGTLTLPGIAGLVLTVGMAVDANVIIFERIREELRAGRAPRPAIATGFKKATWTILDANITTLITALVLFEYGTGPIQGFAVTLSVGILSSVFAALVITRLAFAVYPGTRHVEQVSI